MGESGGRFKRKRMSMYLWLTHVGIWQKLTEYCKAIIFQFKIKKFFKKLRSWHPVPSPHGKKKGEKWR